MLYPVPKVFVDCVAARATDALDTPWVVFVIVFLAFVALRTMDVFAALRAVDSAFEPLRGLAALRDTFCCKFVLVIALRLTVFSVLRAVDRVDVRVVL